MPRSLSRMQDSHFFVLVGVLVDVCRGFWETAKETLRKLNGQDQGIPLEIATGNQKGTKRRQNESVQLSTEATIGLVRKGSLVERQVPENFRQMQWSSDILIELFLRGHGREILEENGPSLPASRIRSFHRHLHVGNIIILLCYPCSLFVHEKLKGNYG